MWVRQSHAMHIKPIQRHSVLTTRSKSLPGLEFVFMYCGLAVVQSFIRRGIGVDIILWSKGQEDCDENTDSDLLLRQQFCCEDYW